MLVVLMKDSILAPHHVCQGCLLADASGQPRWRHGQLGCGRSLEKLADEQPDQYECQMGFRIANIS